MPLSPVSLLMTHFLASPAPRPTCTIHTQQILSYHTDDKLHCPGGHFLPLVEQTLASWMVTESLGPWERPLLALLLYSSQLPGLAPGVPRTSDYLGLRRVLSQSAWWGRWQSEVMESEEALGVMRPGVL